MCAKGVIVALLSVALVGCGDSAESIYDDMNAVWGDLNDVLDDVEDKESAEDARDDIEALVEEFNALSKRMEAYRKENPDEIEEFARREPPEMKRFLSHMRRLASDPEIGRVLDKALQKMGG